MKVLSNFTPTEAFLILYPWKSSRLDLLKATLFDLLFKDVLRVNEQIRYSSKGKKRIVKYISIGSRFENYGFKPHEFVFLEPFLKNNELNIITRHLIKLAIEISISEKNYKNKFLINNKHITPLFNNSFFYNFFNLKRLNSKGKTIKEEIQNELSILEIKLNKLYKENKILAADLVSTVGANIILLSNFNSEILDYISTHIKAEYDALQTSSNSCSSTWSGFDSSCSSGCGSGCNSGCSGCGGCSGCSS